MTRGVDHEACAALATSIVANELVASDVRSRFMHIRLPN